MRLFLTLFHAGCEIISSTLVMYIECFSTRDQTTLTLVLWYQLWYFEGEGLAFVLWAVASSCVPSYIAYQVSQESSLGTCLTVTGLMWPFERVLPAKANLSCLFLYSHLKMIFCPT